MCALDLRKQHDLGLASSASDTWEVDAWGSGGQTKKWQWKKSLSLATACGPEPGPVRDPDERFGLEMNSLGPTIRV